jgi:hypothetical protein
MVTIHEIKRKKTVLLWLIVAFLVFPGNIYAAIDCDTTSVSNAISAASSGDTITCNAGTFAWTSGVTVNKYVKIVGGGAGRIIAYSTSTLTLGTGSKSLTIAPTNTTGTMPTINNGDTLRISELGWRGNYLSGTVTSFNSGTGALVMNITSSAGTIGQTAANAMNSNGKRWLISTTPTTVITNNSASAVLFTITEQSAGNVEISGIKIAAGTGAMKDFYLSNAASGKAILIHDMWLETAGNGGTLIDGNCNRGLVYNTSIDSSPFGLSNTQAFRIKDANGAANPTSWSSASTMGNSDTTGLNNFYFENNDVHAFMGFSDVDDMSRSVFRYNFFNNTGGASHGADTSSYGMRHLEVYNNLGVFNSYTDGSTANMDCWWFIRGGTFVWYNNIFPQVTSQDWGTKGDIKLSIENLQRNAGPAACWPALSGSCTSATAGQYYPAPRQTGMGRVTGSGTDGLGRSTDAYTYVGDSEPAYIWNNKRSSGGSYATATIAVNDGLGAGSDCGNMSACDSTANYIVANRDYFNTTTTAKAGYTAYTYPHPLASGSSPAPAVPVLTGVTLSGGQIQ